MKKAQKIKRVIAVTDQIRDSLIGVIEAGGDFEVEWKNTGMVEINQRFKLLASNGAFDWAIKVPPYKSPSLDKTSKVPNT